MRVTVGIGAYGVSLPLAWLLGQPIGLGARGAWIGETIYIILLGGVFLWRFHGEAWRDIRIFSEDRLPAPHLATASEATSDELEQGETPVP